MFSFFTSDNDISSCPKLLITKFISAQSVREALDLIMADQLAHIIPHQSLAKTVESFDLQKISARGDGHCILHSWEISTGILQSEIKEKLIQEYLAQPLLYSAFDVNVEELKLYLDLKNYSLNTVDAILPMLCNIFNYTAYIFSENRSSSVNEVSTEIQIVNPRFYIPKTDKFAFLIKSGDHYDGLVFLNKGC